MDTGTLEQDEDKRNAISGIISDLNTKSSNFNEDTLFYVKTRINESIQKKYSGVLNGRQKIDLHSFDSSQLNTIVEHEETSNYPISKKDFQNIISNISSTFNDLLRQNDPDPEKQKDNSDKIKGFSLEEIELNFTIEAGVKIVLFDGKGSAGIKLVFKRK